MHVDQGIIKYVLRLWIFLLFTCESLPEFNAVLNSPSYHRDDVINLWIWVVFRKDASLMLVTAMQSKSVLNLNLYHLANHSFWDLWDYPRYLQACYDEHCIHIQYKPYNERVNADWMSFVLKFEGAKTALNEAQKAIVGATQPPL